MSYFQFINKVEILIFFHMRELPYTIKMRGSNLLIVGLLNVSRVSINFKINLIKYNSYIVNTNIKMFIIYTGLIKQLFNF